MSVLLAIVVGFLFVKTLWNLALPFVLHLPSQQDENGISLMPYLDVALWLAALAISAFVQEGAWWQETWLIAVLGPALLVAGIVNFCLVGLLLGMVRNRKTKSR